MLTKKVSFFCFSNGSVKVKFRVVVKVEKAEKKEPLVIAKKVGKTLRVSVEDGRIGSLKVKKTVELRGLFTDYSSLTFFFTLILLPSSICFFFFSEYFPFIIPFIHPSLHSSIGLAFHSCIRSFFHSFFHSFIRLFVHSFISSFVRSFIHSFDRLMGQFRSH